MELVTQQNAGRPSEMFTAEATAGRSPWAVAFSLATHALLVCLVASVAYREVVAPPTQGRRPLQFVRLEAPATVPVELRLPSLPRTVPPTPEVAVPTPAPVLEVLPRPVQPAEAPAVVHRPAAPLPTRQPDVTVGVFASAPRAAMATQPPRQVQPSTFDTPAAVAPELRLKTAVTGAFDAGHAAARPGTDTPKGVVTGTGFDQQASAVTPSTGRALAVTGGAFDAQPAATSGMRAQAVQPTGFGDARPADRPAAPVTRAPVSTTPVDVLFKPIPAYTDDARARGIQGDVVLEVEFSAAGALRVVRVVRGLGYGLDELAVQAARQIRFKPALENGRPVDVKANVVIVFRLS